MSGSAERVAAAAGAPTRREQQGRVSPGAIEVAFVLAGGSTRRVAARPGQTLLEAARAEAVPGLVAICGGNCACATCHVYVADEWMERLPPPVAAERDMLACAWEPRMNSRLSCQIRLTAALSGLVVSVPEFQT